MIKTQSPKLTKAPLTYVLAQIRISPILEMASHIPKLQESLRLKEDLPVYKPISIQVHGFKQSGQVDVQPLTQWHFADKTNTLGVLIDNSSIVVHSSRYESFASIINKIERILGKCNEELKIALYTRIGLRYINVISSAVEKTIEKSLLGFHINGHQDFHDKYFANTETVQETKRGIFKLRTIHVNNPEVQTKPLVPPDLFYSASLLSFDHHQKKSKQEKEYVILDLDHLIDKQGDFEIKHILEKIEKLHDGIEVVFQSAVTKDAIKEWQ